MRLPRTILLSFREQAHMPCKRGYVCSAYREWEASVLPWCVLLNSRSSSATLDWVRPALLEDSSRRGGVPIRRVADADRKDPPCEATRHERHRVDRQLRPCIEDDIFFRAQRGGRVTRMTVIVNLPRKYQLQSFGCLDPSQGCGGSSLLLFAQPPSRTDKGCSLSAR